MSKRATIASQDLEELARKSDKVDLVKLKKAGELKESLRRQGYRPKGYQLASPFDEEQSIFGRRRTDKETRLL